MADYGAQMETLLAANGARGTMTRGKVVPVKTEPLVPGDEPPKTDPPEPGVDYTPNPALDAALEKKMEETYPYRRSKPEDPPEMLLPIPPGATKEQMDAVLKHNQGVAARNKAKGYKGL